MQLEMQLRKLLLVIYRFFSFESRNSTSEMMMVIH